MESPSISTFVEAQPAVIAALKKHRERWNAVNAADRMVIFEAHKVKALIYAFELCIDKMSCGESDDELSEANESLLQKYTTGDSESWFFEYHRAQEVVQLAIVEQCQKVVVAQLEYERIKKENQSCKELAKARSDARDLFNQQQKKEAK